jgi:hypothetical protein
LLGLFAERSLSSAKLRCTSSTSRCKHHGSRICSSRRPILRCLRFVYSYFHSLAHHGYTNIDLLDFYSCDTSHLSMIQFDGMLTLRIMPVHHKFTSTLFS